MKNTELRRVLEMLSAWAEVKICVGPWEGDSPTYYSIENVAYGRIAEEDETPSIILDAKAL
jgi:hypothetical protein